MQLEHRFTVPADIDTVWAALMDPERVAPCLPGATLTEYSGTTFAGTVKVKVGPISLLYKGSGEFMETDEDAHRATIKASGKDSRGNGTATATVTVTLVDQGNTTDGEVRTDLAITGKPAQFGRGLISEVGTKILNIFADCLAKKLAPDTAPAADTAASHDAASAADAPATPAPRTAPAPVNSGTAAPSSTPDTPAPRVTSDSSSAAVPPPTSPNATQPGDIPRTAPNPTRPARRPSPHADTARATPSASATTDEHHPAPEIPTQPTPSRTLRAVPEFEAEPIDLMEIAGHSLKKRLLPAAVVAIVAALVVILRRKR